MYVSPGSHQPECKKVTKGKLSIIRVLLYLDHVLLYLE